MQIVCQAAPSGSLPAGSLTGGEADGVRRFVARDRQHIVDASGRQPQEFEQMLHLTLHGLILQ
ncbi:MAG TPA: hypothetical protein VF777_12295, partial [Phycisphaerales bacterium]